MRTPLLVASLLLIPLAGCVDSAEPTPSSTYPALQSSPIRGLTPEEIRGLEEGEGMGYALPAELNGYPGPKHVLELADQLGLNASQEEATSVVRAEMLVEAKAVGAQLLQAYRDLDAAFRNQTINAERLEELTQHIGELEATLRAVHMGAHLRMMMIMTHAQILEYAELRGYDSGAHGAHDH